MRLIRKLLVGVIVIILLVIAPLKMVLSEYKPKQNVNAFGREEEPCIEPEHTHQASGMDFSNFLERESISLGGTNMIPSYIIFPERNWA